MTDRASVVTGGGRGIGRAITEHLLGHGDAVVVVELDEKAVRWTADHPAADRLIAVVGNAAEETVTEAAADRAEEAGRLAGCVNNAAVFRDAALSTTSAREVVDLVELNLAFGRVDRARLQPPGRAGSGARDPHRGADGRAAPAGPGR